VKAPIEAKVKAATTGAVAGAGLAELLMWLLEAKVVGSPMPEPGRTLFVSSMPGLVAFAAGYMAPHTPRNDPAARRTRTRITPKR